MMQDELHGTCDELTTAADIFERHVRELDLIDDFDAVQRKNGNR